MRWGLGLVLVSCASTSTGVAPSAPSAAQAAWLDSTLGGHADVSFFVRPAAMRADPYWGPIVARAAEHESGSWHRLATTLLGARQIDVHITIRDPLFFAKTKRTDSAAIGWIAIVYGASEQPDTSAIPGAASLTTNDGTFIAADSVSANRVRGDAPRPLDAAPDALAGVTFSVTSLHFIGARAEGSGLFQGIVAVGYGLRGGSNGAIEGYADYATDDDAERAYSAFERSCVEKLGGCIIPPLWFRDAKAVQHDRRITVTLTFSEALLRSLAELR